LISRRDRMDGRGPPVGRGIRPRGQRPAPPIRDPGESWAITGDRPNGEVASTAHGAASIWGRPTACPRSGGVPGAGMSPPPPDRAVSPSLGAGDPNGSPSGCPVRAPAATSVAGALSSRDDLNRSPEASKTELPFQSPAALPSHPARSKLESGGQQPVRECGCGGPTPPTALPPAGEVPPVLPPTAQTGEARKRRTCTWSPLHG